MLDIDDHRTSARVVARDDRVHMVCRVVGDDYVLLGGV